MHKNKQLLKDILLLIVGAGIFTFSVLAFVVPNGLASAGLTGLTIVIYQLFGLETGVSFWIFNIPLLIAGYFLVGKKLFFMTIVGSQSLTLWLLVWHRVPGIQVVFTGNWSFLAAICSGLVGGIGISMIMKSGGSTGGSAIVGVLLNHLKNIPFHKTFLIWDTSVLIIGIMTYLTFPRFALTLVQAFIMSRMVKLLVPNKDAKSAVNPLLTLFKKKAVVE